MSIRTITCTVIFSHLWPLGLKCLIPSESLILGLYFDLNGTKLVAFAEFTIVLSNPYIQYINVIISAARRVTYYFVCATYYGTTKYVLCKAILAQTYVSIKNEKILSSWTGHFCLFSLQKEFPVILAFT